MADRGDRIVSVLEDAFAALMAADPAAFRHKFRKMAAEPFAFYRGSACLFYADMAEMPDEWADERTSRIWIQGDLHAQNFGTYMDSEGTLVFDVNDFDEAYLGSFTWDIRRFAASMALLGWRKALPDSVIGDLVRAYVQLLRRARCARSPNTPATSCSACASTAPRASCTGCCNGPAWPPGSACSPRRPPSPTTTGCSGATGTASTN